MYMKSLIKKIVPESIVRWYRYAKKKLMYVPPEERISLDSQTIFDGHFRVTYRGVPIIKCPFDYPLYQMIIADLKPDLVIEIGTSSGGNALYIADLMEIIGHGAVHTIDIQNKVGTLVAQHPRIKLFTKGWQDYDIAEAKKFSKILVIEDASHMYEDTLATLHKFAPLVSMNSYLVVEDGIINELGKEKGFHGGPLRAIREFLQSNKNFEVDRTWCDMFGKNATFNVNGYLKRVR